MSSASKQASDAEAEEEMDFFNVDTVVLLDEDFRDIVAIKQLSHTATDKINFTVFCMNIILTGFVSGNVPQYFYLWHTWKFFMLLPYRWYAYKKQRDHYFLFDFCYFLNVVTLLFLWLPFDTSALFPMLYTISHGTLLAAVILWRNSLVPHSVDKMTSLFLHISPCLTTWGLRWYTTDEQGFVRCAEIVDGICVFSVTWKELLLWPMAFFLTWQITYTLIVDVWRGKRVKERGCSTAFTYLVERQKKGFVYNIFSYFPPGLRKPMFVLLQLAFMQVTVLPAYFSFYSYKFSMAVVIFVVAVASYNGATFYVDVFGQKYYDQHKSKKK